MATKLAVYNEALRHLGATRLDATLGLNENRPDRRELDAAWDGTLQEMVEHAIWKFAVRTFHADADPNIVPAFGQRYGYDMPDDFVRLHKICTDDSLTTEDLTYTREGPSRIFSDNSELYLSIVSKDPAYGLNIGAYTALYAKALACLLAVNACVAITKDQNLQTKKLREFETLHLPRAKRKDAIDERVKTKPQSSWVRARFISGRNTYRGRIA